MSATAPGGPPEASERAVLERIAVLSSQILDTAGLKGGRVTPGAPMVVRGMEGMGDTFAVLHCWSVYRLDDAVLGLGFQRLRDGLPGRGWTLLAHGESGDAARTPALEAATADFYATRVEWIATSEAGPGMLHVEVTSPSHILP